jgi:hypothetical protein
VPQWPPAPALFRILVISWTTAHNYAHTRISATTLKICQNSTYKLIDNIALTCHVAPSSQLRTKIYLTLLPRVDHGTFVAHSLLFYVICMSVNSRTRNLLTCLKKIASSCYCHASAYKIIDTVILTCNVALSPQLTLKTYFTLPSRVENVMFAVQSLLFSVCCTSVNSRTCKLLASHTITASSYNVHTFATSLLICHASNSLLLNTVTLTCYATLFPLLIVNVYLATSTCTEYVTLNANILTLSASCTSDNLCTRIMPTRFTVIACIIVLGGGNILIVILSYSYNP